MLGVLQHTFHIPAGLLWMAHSYLKTCALLYDILEGHRCISVTFRAAPVSFLEHDPWNSSYDRVLRTVMAVETHLVGFADDRWWRAICRENIEVAQLRLGMVMRRVKEWMRDYDLSLALRKSEILVHIEKRTQTITPIRVAELEVDT